MSITLFAYDPTLTVAGLGGTFTRADASTCATYVDANGVVQTVAANVLRNSHYVNGVRTTLLEGSRANSALGACTFGDTTRWANPGAETLASATSCVSGQTAAKHTATDTGSPRTQTIGTFVNGQSDCLSMIVEQGNIAVAEIAIRDLTVPAQAAHVRLTWATMAVTTLAGSPAASGATLLNATGPNGGKLALFWVSFTGTAAGTGANGNSRAAFLYPLGQACSIGDTVYLHAAQFEANAKFPSSLIVTAAAAVTRAADALSFPFLPVPQAMTCYADFYDLGTYATSNGGIGSVGGTTGASLQFYSNGSGIYNTFHSNGSTSVTKATGAAATFSDRVELRFPVQSDGSVFIGQSLNSGTETVSTTSAANTFASAWNATTVFVGQMSAGGFTGFAAFRSLKIASGVQSLATMRGLTATSGVVSATLAPSSVVAEGAWYAQPAYTVLDTGTATALQASAIPTNTNQQVRVLRLDVTCSAAPAAGTIVNIQDGGTVLWQGVLSAGSRKLTVDFTRKPLRGSRGATVTAEMASAGGSVVQTIVMTCDTVRAP